MIDQTATFPPSFDGNPWSFGIALFSLTLICALSMTKLMSFWFDVRVRRAVARFQPRPLPRWNLLDVHRTITSCLLLTILSGAMPDVLVLLAWGETSDRVMVTLTLVDRIGDGLTMVPFLAAAFLQAWGAQVIPQRLTTEAAVQFATPQWWMIRDSVKIAGLVSLIAIGVTVGKVYA